ncbi:MAG: FAD-dependent oxidoreductase [Polyangiaceae bacterium]
MQRRAFLTAVGSGWLLDGVLPGRRAIAGRVVGASMQAGHRLRDGAALPAVEPSERADVVIVGGGVSGLAAAWRLGAAGLDVRVLELEPFLGGTSAAGRDGVVPYPWGAHYLAAPNPGARAALRLLEELGVLRGWDAAGNPRFDPRVLCHAPDERLFYRGAWHAGLVPADALEPAELAEVERFHAVERALSERVGRDGRAAFQIPVSDSSRDPELLALDTMTMAEWLEREGFRSPFLRWYVRYALLDDFGGEPSQVSAWAGLHYFASRKVRTPELEGSHFLVWPEGNGFLVEAMARRSGARLQTGALVHAVHQGPGEVAVDWLDLASGRNRRLAGRALVLAVPAFVCRRLVPEAAPRLPSRVASPWLVANLHVERPFDPDLAWDSVLHEGAGLGYVDAGHQRTAPSDRTVLTYYRAWGGADVSAARTRLASAAWPELADLVLADLTAPHPDLREELARMDLMVWGHAMPRPVPGFLGAQPFDTEPRLGERIAWAHVDQTGMALFEEAQARGVRAAEALAAPLSLDLGPTWL